MQQKKNAIFKHDRINLNSIFDPPIIVKTIHITHTSPKYKHHHQQELLI